MQKNLTIKQKDNNIFTNFFDDFSSLKRYNLHMTKAINTFISYVERL